MINMKETKKFMLKTAPKMLENYGVCIKRKNIEKVELTPYLMTMVDGFQNYCYKVILTVKSGSKISFKYENETNKSMRQVLKNVCVYF